MRLRVFLGLLAMLLPAPVGVAIATTPPSPTPPPVTVNEFLPEDRGLGECISAVPKPGCGSEARGGWHQTLVLLAILVGLMLIVWRVVAGARKARAAAASTGSESYR